MNALSRTTLRTDDLDDQLQFTLTRDVGWLEVAILVSLACGLGIWGLLTGNAWGYLVCGGVIIAMLINWAQGPTTTFRISGNHILASGKANADIPANEVKSIGWSSGDEYSSSGLYVWHGWRSTCVLPGLSKMKAVEVTDAISKKFPQFRIGSAHVWSFGFTIGS